MKAKTKTVGTPPQIVQAVIQGEAATRNFLTSVFAVPGVELAGQFPGDLQQDLVYTAAPSTITKDAAAPRRHGFPEVAGGSRNTQGKRHAAG